ncbi:MAG: ABC transporter substrate-binding protein [Pseudomonadota bacterium]
MRALPAALALWLAALTTGAMMPAMAAGYQITDSFGKHYFERPPARVVVTDWALLEQLLELGIEPVGAPELDAYRRLVRQPALPARIVDIGLRRSPTLETLRTLDADVILLGTGQKDLARPFSRITRVLYYQSFSDRYRGNGKKSRVRFLELADLFQRRALAQRKLATMDARIAELRAAIAARFGTTPPKVTPIRFSSEDRVLIYGTNSLPHYALEQLGLESDFPLPRSRWGEAELPLARLAEVDEGYLFYFEPADVFNTIAATPQWQTLPTVRTDRVRALPPTWTTGGAMSVLYLAEAMAAALLAESG